MDITLVFPLRRNGEARPRASREDGAAIADACLRKRRRYLEFGARGRCRLVVLVLEVGGRWGDEALDLVRLLARAKARAAPPLLRRSAQQAWQSRWSGILAVAAHRALAASLLDLDLGAVACVDGVEPPLGDALAVGASAGSPQVSRMPPRIR